MKKILPVIIICFLPVWLYAFDLSVQAGYQSINAEDFNDSLESMHKKMILNGYTGTYVKYGSYTINYNVLLKTQIYNSIIFHARLSYLPLWLNRAAQYYYPNPGHWLAYELYYFVNHYYGGAGLGYNFKINDSFSMDLQADAGLDAVQEYIFDYAYNYNGNVEPGESVNWSYGMAGFIDMAFKYEFFTGWNAAVIVGYNSVGKGMTYNLSVERKI